MPLLNISFYLSALLYTYKSLLGVADDKIIIFFVNRLSYCYLLSCKKSLYTESVCESLIIELLGLLHNYFPVSPIQFACVFERPFLSFITTKQPLLVGQTLSSPQKF